VIRIVVTGGTFDKTYDEINGRLSFGSTHLPEMLRLGRSRVETTIETADDDRQSRHDRRRSRADR
jgi:L-asparaginase